MCGSMVDIQSAAAEIRRGKKEEDRKKETKGGRHHPNWSPATSATSSADVATHNAWSTLAAVMPGPHSQQWCLVHTTTTHSSDVRSTR